MTRTATIVLSTLLVVLSAAAAQSQTQPAPKTLAATVGVYVFPAEWKAADRKSGVPISISELLRSLPECGDKPGVRLPKRFPDLSFDRMKKGGW